jgi:hypothetical protein
MPTLYDEDVALWAEQQGRLLREAARRGNNGPIDWDNVAEEIESLGNVQAHEIRRRLARIVEHLLKLQFSPAREPRRGWRILRRCDGACRKCWNGLPPGRRSGRPRASNFGERSRPAKR